jgi:hypothetical protein
VICPSSLSLRHGKEDKNAMREFYKTVRSKPKGKTRKGMDAEYVDE